MDLRHLIESVTEKLRGIDKSKAGGPDGLPGWLLNTYADIIAPAVTDVLNSSFLECKVPNNYMENGRYSTTSQGSRY